MTATTAPVQQKQRSEKDPMRFHLHYHGKGKGAGILRTFGKRQQFYGARLGRRL